MDPAAATSTPLTDVNLSACDDATLIAVRSEIDAELRRRAIDSGDLSALAAEAFTTGFTPSGEALAPWVHGRVLICPGSKAASSSLSHKCRFVAIDDTWVWEHPEVLLDEIRPRGPHSTTSVTLVVARDDYQVEMVTSRARGGTHSRMSVEQYRVEGESVTSLGRRNAPPRPHR